MLAIFANHATIAPKHSTPREACHAYPHVNLTDKLYAAKLAPLRTAIDEGDASGLAKGDVFARVRKTLKLPVKAR